MLELDITREGFLARMKQAIAEQRLAIQNEEGVIAFLKSNPDQSCMNAYPDKFFDGKTCHCIVGSAIPSELASYYAYEGATNILRELKVEDEGVRSLLIDLQIEHDRLLAGNWSYRLEMGDVAEWRIERDKFLAKVETLT